MPLYFNQITASDAKAIHTNQSSEIYGLTEKSLPAASDVFIAEDSANSYSKKKITVSDLLISSTCYASWSKTVSQAPNSGGAWTNLTLDTLVANTNTGIFSQPTGNSAGIQVAVRPLEILYAGRIRRIDGLLAALCRLRGSGRTRRALVRDLKSQLVRCVLHTESSVLRVERGLRRGTGYVASAGHGILSVERRAVHGCRVYALGLQSSGAVGASRLVGGVRIGDCHTLQFLYVFLRAVIRSLLRFLALNSGELRTIGREVLTRGRADLARHRVCLIGYTAEIVLRVLVVRSGRVHGLRRIGGGLTGGRVR